MKQCRKPTGFLGKILAWEMNLGHSKLTDWGLKQVTIGKDDVILDVGCGGGGTVSKLAGKAQDGKVYGVDFSMESVEVARRTNKRLIQRGRVEIHHASVSSLPFPGNLFDLVTAFETHYFWPDIVDDMREVKRVLKPGGRLLIVGEAYRGGKNDEQNRRLMELGEMTYHSLDELTGFYSDADYVEVQVFDDMDTGWVCGVGVKPQISS
ncbi:class I SAM-dependent methyltransferase [Candidatus Bathyarchaeota archaeon]|nr:class I SAM-dependent methyltransferase [Candidatus Bathyarchaeota archaeon]